MDTVDARPMTFGEQAVGISFNPSGDPQVHEIKREFAAVIDRLNTRRSADVSKEVARMLSVAITEAQTAQMWAVKAVTWKS